MKDLDELSPVRECRMKHHLLIGLMIATLLIMGCQPAAAALTDEPVTTEPTVEATAAAITATEPATETTAPTVQITAPPTVVPAIEYGPVPTLSLETYSVA